LVSFFAPAAAPQSLAAHSLAMRPDAVTLLVLGGLPWGLEAGAELLTKDNFESKVFESGKGALVKFLAPW